MIEASRIAPGLEQGSRPPQGVELAEAGYGVLVLMADEHQPSADRFPGVEVIHLPIDDAAMTPELLGKLARLGDRLADRVRAGKRVLVTCSQGRNRSGLVAALTLRALTGCSGMQALATVRARRKSPWGSALANPAFADALRKLPAASAPSSHVTGQLIDPYALGQEAAQSLGIGQPSAAEQAYQDQAQRAADLLKTQQMQASGAAKAASSGISGAVLLGVSVLALVWLVRSK